MNFKQFISGVSAFAVASGAFAGMAISANAAYDKNTVTGTVVWDFEDYTAENENYSMFEAVNTTIETTGVYAGRQANFVTETEGIKTMGKGLKFTAPENGYLSFTLQNTATSERFCIGVIYDAELNSLYQSDKVSKGLTSTTATIEVTKDKAYYLSTPGYSNRGDVDAKIIGVTFAPDYYEAEYKEPTELPFTNKALFEAMNGATVTMTSMTFDRQQASHNIDTDQVVKFTAPTDGEISVTFKAEDTKGRQADVYILDSKGETLKTSNITIKDGSDNESVLNQEVQKDTVYYLTGQANNSKYPTKTMITKVLFTPKVEEPVITATLTSVESQSYSTEEGYDENVTAAKLHVTVANGSAPIKVTYSGKEQTTETSLEGDVVIGAILRGINAQVQQADFAVTVE